MKENAAGHDWSDKPAGLAEAVLYNRRLWIIFIDAVIRDDNRLPLALRQNILNIGAFVMALFVDDQTQTGECQSHPHQSPDRGRP